MPDPRMRREQDGRSRNLTQRVQDTLLSWIRTRKYPTGSQLPSVQELVRHFNVSRTVVREALQSLAGLNLIEMRAGLGCFVKRISPELVINADVMASLLGMESLMDVVSARLVIETGIGRLAAVTATEDDFEEMEDILRRIKRASEKNQPMHSITPLFHIALARATHNLVLEKIVSSFNMLMDTAGILIEDSEVGARYRMQEYESHLYLFEVLKERNSDKMALAMEEHIGRTLATLRQIPSHDLPPVTPEPVNAARSRVRPIRSGRSHVSVVRET